jgi:hypothetical protein
VTSNALPVARAELVALAEKYETLAALRRARERGEPAPEKSAIQSLAARFPGALYELDTLPLEVIDERASALRRASESLVQGHVPAWMTWMARYHALVREDLASRRERRAEVPRPRATATAVATIAREASTPREEIEAALFARKRRGVGR